jgi:predicted deacylase
MKILDTKIEKGKTYQLAMEIAKLHTRSKINIPVIVSRAKKDGPILLLNAGVHGDELNGVEIVRRIIHQKYNIPEVGTIICIPVLNIFGYLNQSRKFPDGRDLNRMFPGSKNGSLASQVAYKFRTEIAPHIDIMLDFHTGGAKRINAPQIRYAKNDEKASELAQVFNPPYIVYSKTIQKSMRDMVHKLGKTILLFEGGKSQIFEENVITQGVEGTLRIMHYLGMTKENPTQKSQSVIITKSSWIRASYSGMLHVGIANGEKVKKGQVLGFIAGPYGDFNKAIKSTIDGHIFCVNSAPIVNKGDALFHISNEYESISKK